MMVRHSRDFREDQMGRRFHRDLRPDLEQFEHRELLSAITDVMSGHGLHSSRHTQRASVNPAGGGGNSGSVSTISGGFSASISLGGATLNQGPLLNPDGTINNMALAPTGTPKPGQLKRERFVARYVGPYSVVPGQTSTQAIQTLIQGAGTANTMLHSDIQMRLVTPRDPSLPIGGVSSIFDRNINTNTVLGLDFAASQQDVDSGGRPSHFPIVTIDANISSGTYVESYAQGVVNIHYIPGGRRTIPGAISQGTAVVTIHAQIYSANASFILRNTSINP
jgi:hypothetical protein